MPEPLSMELTLDDVAGRLKLSPWVVRQLCRRGELVGYQFGREWRFREADVDAFVQRSRNGPSEPTSESA